MTTDLDMLTDSQLVDELVKRGWTVGRSTGYDSERVTLYSPWTPKAVA